MKRHEKKLLSEILALSGRLREDRLYEIAFKEIEQNTPDHAALARALEESCGDTAKANSLYIKHRVRRLMDLASEEALRRSKEEAEMQKHEEEARRKRAAEETAEAEVRKKIIEYNNSFRPKPLSWWRK